MEKVRDFPREMGIAKEGFAETKELFFLPKGIIVFIYTKIKNIL